MSDRRNLLLPDDEGHYEAQTHALDAESHRRIARGRHPLDGLAAEMAREESRRRFFGRGAQGIGALALAHLMGGAGSAFGADAAARSPFAEAKRIGGLDQLPHFAPKARRCIYLHLVGAPPQMETYDYKPKMDELFDTDLPDSIRQGQRLTTMTCRADTLSDCAVDVQVPAARQVRRVGCPNCCPTPRRWSTTSPSSARMHTEAINHEPAITFIQTGRQIAGRPCIGAWIAYGLGTHEPRSAGLRRAERGPARTPRRTCRRSRRGFGARAFCPREYAGVALAAPARPGALRQQPGRRAHRRCAAACSTALGKLNQITFQSLGDPETLARIEQYEMAFRMQSLRPGTHRPFERAERRLRDATDRDAKKPGTFATSCSSRGDWPSAACDSFSFTIAAGTSTATCRRCSPASATTSTSPATP